MSKWIKRCKKCLYKIYRGDYSFLNETTRLCLELSLIFGGIVMIVFGIWSGMFSLIGIGYLITIIGFISLWFNSGISLRPDDDSLVGVWFFVILGVPIILFLIPFIGLETCGFHDFDNCAKNTWLKSHPEFSEICIEQSKNDHFGTNPYCTGNCYISTITKCQNRLNQAEENRLRSEFCKENGDRIFEKSYKMETTEGETDMMTCCKAIRDNVCEGILEIEYSEYEEWKEIQHEVIQ